MSASIASATAPSKPQGLCGATVDDTLIDT